jgi:hypothetical protein
MSERKIPAGLFDQINTAYANAVDQVENDEVKVAKVAATLTVGRDKEGSMVVDFTLNANRTDKLQWNP